MKIQKFKKALLWVLLILMILEEGVYCKIKISRDPFAPSELALQKIELMQSALMQTDKSLAKANKQKLEQLKKQKRTKVILTGIIKDNKEYEAILDFDGKSVVLTKNQSYKGAELVRVNLNSVKLKYNSKTYILKLGREILL